jgi:hypothetical protein
LIFVAAKKSKLDMLTRPKRRHAPSARAQASAEQNRETANAKKKKAKKVPLKKVVSKAKPAKKRVIHVVLILLMLEFFCHIVCMMPTHVFFQTAKNIRASTNIANASTCAQVALRFPKQNPPSSINIPVSRQVRLAKKSQQRQNLGQDLSHWVVRDSSSSSSSASSTCSSTSSSISFSTSNSAAPVPVIGSEAKDEDVEMEPVSEQSQEATPSIEHRYVSLFPTELVIPDTPCSGTGHTKILTLLPLVHPWITRDSTRRRTTRRLSYIRYGSEPCVVVQNVPTRSNRAHIFSFRSFSCFSAFGDHDHDYAKKA